MGNCVKSPLRNLSKKVCSRNEVRCASPALLPGMGDVMGRWEWEVAETHRQREGFGALQQTSVGAAAATAAVRARDAERPKV